jgi:hypothetical protein
MTPESRKYAVREAQHRRLLLDNGCVNIVPAATNKYMNYSGNRYTDYNKQTVVVGIFYTVLAKS